MNAIHIALRHWPLTAAALSAAALAVAIASEVFAGLLPCSLCLRQRQVFVLAIVVGVVTWLLARAWPRARVDRIACLGLAVLFAAGAVLAGYHAGVEWGWFPGPAECSGGRFEIDDLLDQLRQPVETVSCKAAAVRVLGLSMAGWNSLYSAALAGASLFALRYGERR